MIKIASQTSRVKMGTAFCRETILLLSPSRCPGIYGKGRNRKPTLTDRANRPTPILYNARARLEKNPAKSVIPHPSRGIPRAKLTMKSANPMATRYFTSHTI
jgi:hypothetical protein